MILREITDLLKNDRPLVPASVPVPVPQGNELLLKVSACGVCHTELDEIEGRTPPPFLPVIPGHQVTGRVAGMGPGASRYKIDDRLGVAWIFSSCGKCDHCLSGNENLCSYFKATGRDVNGGYAEYMTVPESFVHLLPERFTDVEAAPLLCAGAIGYRSLRLAGNDLIPAPGSFGLTGKEKKTLGLTGFGASAHLVLKLIRYLSPATSVFVFARSEREQAFALELGADWAGGFADVPPGKPDAIIDTTPVWYPVLKALEHLKPGGRLVINAIRKENTDKESLLSLDYPAHLWMEKEIKSVANVALNDVREFLRLAAEIPILPEVQVFPLEDANRALLELKQQKIRGAKVLKIV